jgi:NADPH2:quinone reductase
MRAVVGRELGPPERLVLEDREPAVAGRGQVVLDVRAAGVNFVDTLFIRGAYQIKPEPPFVPGGEVAGVVSAIGEGVDGVHVGQRAIAMCGIGGFAEQVVVRPGQLLPLPDGLDFARAAALTQSYCTALYALEERAELVSGEWLLVLGAAGGVGLAAIDVAVARGARVIAAASTEAKRASCLEAGAEAVIDYENEDLKLRARELSGGGVDVVFDPVGGPHAEAALRALGWRGRFLVIGFAAGGIPRIPLNLVLLNTRNVLGVDWGAMTIREPERNRLLMQRMVEGVASGRLHPAEPRTYPLERAADALGDLAARRIAGKAVLVNEAS